MLGLKFTRQFSQNQSKPTLAVHDLKFVAFKPTQPGWKTLPHDPLHKTLLSDLTKFLAQALYASMIPKFLTLEENNYENGLPLSSAI